MLGKLTRAEREEWRNQGRDAFEANPSAMYPDNIPFPESKFSGPNYLRREFWLLGWWAHFYYRNPA